MTVARAVGAGAVVAVAAVLALVWLPQSPGQAAGKLPASLADAEFWRLSTSFSEPGGTFHSDNFVSNEGQFQSVIPELLKRARENGVYLGVGPEQNFTYISALRPRMAFIIDIRRGNLHLHLLYKALFELSPTRVEFLSRLFSREVPVGVGTDATAEQLFAAVAGAPPTEGRYRQNLQAVLARLRAAHGFGLTQEDIAGIDYVYRTAFFADGPELNYRLLGQQGAARSGLPSYAELMALDDGEGTERSYLATEDRFAFVKDLQSRNMLVPVVGDFGGPKALRRVGQFARDNGAIVSAFYLSNVEQYLRQDGKETLFCANVASMPLDETSTFIRTVRGGTRGRQNGTFSMFSTSLGEMRDAVRECPSR